MNIDSKKLLKLGEKHQKLFESTNINPYAYFYDNTPYYFVAYKSKWSGTTKGFAIITPEKGNSQAATYAFSAHTNYAITANIIEGGSDRANVDFTLHKSVREYLQNVLKDENLDFNKEKIYKRAYTIIDNMLRLQNEFVELWEEANQFVNDTDSKGYFTDEEMEKLIKYIPVFNLIQYKQLKPRYDNRTDFDVIYQNRDNLNRKTSFTEENMLKEMTSGTTEGELEGLLHSLTKNIIINDKHSYDEIHNKWLEYYRHGLQDRVEKDIKILRYP